MFRLLDLFSGIGGFSLGLEASGAFKTVAFCEIDPFCRRVLAKRWSGVPIYDDIQTLTGDCLRSNGIAVDAICGGFPCQDISIAGKGAGLAGERSGLWGEYARIVGELRPRIVIVENVSALLSRGLDAVLADLAALGFDAEWHCIPASAVGAPHRRDRIWIIACASSGLVREQSGRWDGAGGTGAALSGVDGAQGYVADSDSAGCRESKESEAWSREQGAGHGMDRAAGGRGDANLADASGAGLSPSEREAILSPRRWHEGRATAERGWWSAEPDVGRVVDGVSARLDRRKRLIGLGNAVVPKIPQIIGLAIKDHFNA